MARLAGKVAIVTGAASGMGLSTAKLFHAEGASLVLTDLSGKVVDVAAELGDRAVSFVGDISKKETAEALVALALKEFGKLDVLCNVAGIAGQLVDFTEITDDNFDLMINVNLRGVFFTMREAIATMIASGGGSIVNVASAAAIKGYPQLSTYSAAKAGVAALTKSVATEYAEAGVRVNCVCPGMIDTPMHAAAREDNLELDEWFATLTPSKRMGKPHEIASAILFFASDEASYVTGTVLAVDGGQLA